MSEKTGKKLFWIIIGITFIMIYLYNFLTPYLSDDYFYAIEVRNANSFWDLFKQQYQEYLSNSGRVIGQFNVRLSLIYSKQVFNIVNSGMFVALVGLVYCNIRRRKKYDFLVLLLILAFLWKYAVSFGQTMLWICGSCNYLWGSVIILGFITFFRYFLEHTDKIRKPVLLAAGAFLFGIPAGWCNENTSGGGLLIILLLSLNFWWQQRKKNEKSVYGFMLTGILGMCCGLAGMVLSPGVRGRSEVMSAGEYTGIVGMLSRFYKITMSIETLFGEVLIITTIVLVLLVLQKKLSSWQLIRCNETVLFLFASVATSYALIMAPTPMNRAFFGAGIFLFIACIQGINDIANSELFIRLLKYSLVSLLCLWLCFTYFSNLVNLARIYREDRERIALITEAENSEQEDTLVIVPKYREAFINPYSDAHNADMTDDSDYWINTFYEAYYGVDMIKAIPREEWNELYGE